MYVIKILFGINCECECNKAFDFSEHLDYKNCTFKKRLVNKFVEECNENIDEVKLTKRSHTENGNSCKHNSCIVYIVLFSMFFTINFAIGAYFLYYKYMNHNKKMFLNIMIIFITHNIKWGTSNN